jgi:hypothetical protein
MKPLFAIFLILLAFDIVAQDAGEPEDDTEIVRSAFKGTHVINGHSTRTKYKGEVDFLIYHRFGPINSGIQEFFGLDEANMRLGFEYGLFDVLDLGIGRSTYNKTYDGYVKWKALQQKSGSGSIPISLVLLTSAAISTGPLLQDLSAAEKMGFNTEILVSRKFNDNLTLQIMPGLVHNNTVPAAGDPNTIPYLGTVLRVVVAPGIALTGEYYYRFNEYESVQTYDPIGFGLDIHTSGHVFQLHVTNSRPTYESGFISSTIDNFWDGGIRFGFNISRTFQVNY